MMYYYCCLLLLLFNNLLSGTIALDLEKHFWKRNVTYDFEPSEYKADMIKFNNKQFYPMMGLGTWQHKSNLSEAEKIKMYEIVKKAIDIGYRHIDCASSYNNEEYVGKAIAEKIKAGIIKREDIYVTSKLWNNKHDPKDVEGQLRSSLKSLGLKYLDLYLIHWPFATIDPINSDEPSKEANISYVHTWRAMEECVRLGLTKSIGISNFNIDQVADILHRAKIKPVVNQIENHPYLTQNVLKDFCERNGIRIIAYGALGAPYRGSEQVLLAEHYVQQMSYKYDRTPAQILLKFQVQRGNIVLSSSTNPHRLKENFQIWDFEMTPEEIHLLKLLNRNLRFCRFSSAEHYNDYPFKTAEHHK